MSEVYRSIIENYIKAYNRFDVGGMTADMDKDIKFENISDGEVTLTTHGIAELREQAAKGNQLFRHREMKITGFQYHGDEVEVIVDYCGTLAGDFTSELRAGSKIELKGKSIFIFKDNKIVELRDIS